MRLALLASLLLCAACTPWEEPAVAPELPARVVSTVPADEARHVPGTIQIAVTWDRVPDDVVFTVRGPGGATVPGEVTGDPRGVSRAFLAGVPLQPDSDYVIDVAWSNVDGEHTFGFETSLLGFPLSEDDIEELPGQTWAMQPVDLSGLEQLPIVPSGPDIAFLLAVHKDADPETGRVHLVLAQTVTGSLLQDQCVETAVITAGRDGALGSSDDAPALWDNPNLTAAGPRFAPGNGTAAGGTDAQQDQLALRDWELDATVLPDAEGLWIHRFSARIDTSGLDDLVPQPQGSDALTFCDVYEQFGGGTCSPCPSLGRDSRCIDVETRDIEGSVRGTQLRVRTCADIIDSAHGTFLCQGDDARYDADGDGVYELCPEYEAR